MSSRHMEAVDIAKDAMDKVLIDRKVSSMSAAIVIEELNDGSFYIHFVTNLQPALQTLVLKTLSRKQRAGEFG